MAVSTEEKYIIRSPFPATGVPAEDVFSYLTKLMSQHGEKCALVGSASATSYTFTSLYQTAENLAQHMQHLGFAHGDKLGLFAPNSPEYIITQLAVWRLRGVVVFINNLLSSGEARREIIRTNCRFMMFGEQQTKAAQRVLQGTNVKHAFADGDCATFPPITSLFSRPSIDMKPLPVNENPGDTEETISIFFSSGTTGLPKGVELNHRNILARIHCEIASPMERETQTMIIYQPLSHIYGHTRSLLGLAAGATVVIMPRFDLGTFLSLTSSYKCKTMFLVPPIVVLMSKNRHLVEKFDLSCVERIGCGAAPLPLEAEKEFLDLLPVKIEMIQQGYGMTESTAGICMTPDLRLVKEKPQRLFQIGAPVPNMIFKIIDDVTGESLPPYKHGEICFKGPQVMKGYLDNKEATERTIDAQGWLHSGDVGYHDEHGYIYLIDRIKELIKYKGFQVAPAELEDVLLSHPDVADAGVIGVLNEEGGEAPRAFVVCKPSRKVTEEDVINFVAGKVAPYKRLRGGVCFVAVIPKSASGKVLRRELRDMMNKSKM